MPSIRKHKKTSNVDVLLGEVRKHYGRVDLYQHFSQDMDRVTKAQVALDTAEDAMLAISNYEGGDVDSDDGEKYLKLYGFLQAVFLQQDAIKELHELFVGKFAEPGKASNWRRIRELRNLTVGRPIEKGRRKEPRQRTFITRVSVTKGVSIIRCGIKEAGRPHSREPICRLFAPRTNGKQAPTCERS